MRKWRKLMFSKTRNKLILGAAVVLMIAILAVTLALYSTATRALTAQSRETVWQQTQQLQKTLGVELAEYEKLLLSMRLDRSLHDQIKRTDFENYTDFSVKMGEVGVRIRSSTSACAYIPDVKLYLAPEYPYELPPDELVFPISDARDEPWMQQALQSNRSQLTWSTYTVQVSETSTRTMLRATMPIVDRDYGTLLAVVCLQQRMRYVVSSLTETVDLENGQLYILDDAGKLVCGIRQKSEVTAMDEDLAQALPPVEQLQQGIMDLEDYTLFSVYDAKRNWHILYITDGNLFMERHFQFGQRTLIVLVLTILLSLALVFVASDVATRRLRRLTAAVKTVDEKTLQIPYTDDGKDEVSDLYRAFSKLLQRVRNLIDRNQRIEQEKYALELQTLQEQIAPHFLYNTLSSINAMAQDIEADDISTAVLSLAEFYRLSLSNGATIISIGTEQTLLDYYVQICHTRFGNKVTVELDFDPALSQYATPKLVLQPFVENAIMHGLRERGATMCHVKVSTYSDEDHIYMQVADDGVGMSEERLAQILNQPYDPNKHHAIQNIHRRIQLFGGADYGVHISSCPEQGTTVRITLPKIPI